MLEKQSYRHEALNYSAGICNSSLIPSLVMLSMVT